MFLSFLDQIEAKDKECYDEIFNDFKRFLYKHNCHWTDKEIRDHLEYKLENNYHLKSDFIYQITNDDLILDNLHEFTEYCSVNVESLL